MAATTEWIDQVKHHADFRAIRAASLASVDRGPLPMKVAGNPNVIKEAAGRKHGGKVTATAGKRAKRAVPMDGGKSRHRADRPSRAKGGHVPKTAHLVTVGAPVAGVGHVNRGAPTADEGHAIDRHGGRAFAKGGAVKRTRRRNRADGGGVDPTEFSQPELGDVVSAAVPAAARSAARRGGEFVSVLPSAWDLGARGAEGLVHWVAPDSVVDKAMRGARQFTDTNPNVRRHRYEDLSSQMRGDEAGPQGPGVAYARGGGVKPKHGPAWREGVRNGTQAQNNPSGKNDQQDVGRGRPITYRRGGRV